MDGAANVFLGGVRHGEMTVKLPAHAGIDMRFVGHEAAIPMNVPADNRAQDLGSHVRDMEATDRATPLDQRHDRKLGLGSLISAVLGLRADIGFVGLDSLSFTADRGKRTGRACRSWLRGCDAQGTKLFSCCNEACAGFGGC